MVMRVGGIASGMDIEAMVQKLMEAERMPLTRLQQQQTTLTWKRDAFRDINSKLLELDNMMLDMKLSSSYKPKTAVSSQDAVSVTAGSGAYNGSYTINVSQLARGEMWVAESEENNPINSDETFSAGKYAFQTYDENGEPITHTLEIENGDSLNTVLKNIGKASNGQVNAFYDETEKRIIMETTRTGVYNQNNNGTEITFDETDGNSGLNQLFGFEKKSDAQNAKFTYNDGLEITNSRNNNYTLNGITFEFNDVTDGNARVTVSSNVDEAFDKIKEFVDKYNEAIDAMNQSQTEEKFRDFPPLTKEQEEEMTERQIEQWEEKAKSGILRGETTIRDGMYKLRQSLQSYVETDGEYNLLSQIGISTTKNYLDGGKLEIDEEKLKTALRENPDDVFKLFSNNDSGDGRGLINRFDDTLDQTKAQFERKAGNSTHTLENYSIGKQIKELNERITVFEKRMIQVEQRYWNQFTAMEKAISRLNQQADYLYSQFGG